MRWEDTMMLIFVMIVYGSYLWTGYPFESAAVSILTVCAIYLVFIWVEMGS